MGKQHDAHAVAAIQFFSMPGERQMESWHKVRQADVPWFFDAAPKDHGRECDYFYGVYCVLRTYVWSLYDRFPTSDDAEHLQDLLHRLAANVVTFGTAEEWSEQALLGSRHWETTRQYAKSALEELGEPLPDTVPTFDIAALIDPDEWRASEEVRRLLE